MERNELETNAWNEFQPVVSFANRLVCPPEFAFGPRVIASHQFIYVADGCGTAQIQSRTYEAVPGDLFYYGPDIVHRFQADATRPFVLYGVHFSLNELIPENGILYADGIVQVSGLEYRAGNRNQLRIGGGMNPIDVPERCNDGLRWIEPQFRELVRHFDQTEASAHVRNRAIFMQFMLELRDWLAAPAPFPDDRPRLMADVREKLQRHAALPYDRSWLREWTRFHENYASRLFREQFGMSPHQYFMEQKIHIAKQMLAESDLPVGAIADRLHMGSIHYFSLLFKQRTGHAPLDYRKLRRTI